jgi:hypothetical protein
MLTSVDSDRIKIDRFIFVVTPIKGCLYIYQKKRNDKKSKW